MTLIGRERERAVWHDRLAQARDGRGHTVLITGEPGIGKSSLLAQFVGDARAQDGLVLTGRAVPGAGPYRSLTEALMVPVRAGLVAETASLRPFRAALGRILPGWASGAASEPGVDPVVLLGEGVLRLLLSIEAPVRVLALDDLQYADPDTLAVLEYLAAAVAELPILILGGQGDWPPSSALNRVTARPAATRVALTRLSATKVAGLIDSVKPVPAEVRDAVVARAEGLPLVVTELLTDLAEQPSVSTRVPETFADLVQARLSALSSDERRLLAVAAVLGPSPAYWPLAPELAGVDAAAAAAGWASGLDVNLLVTDGDEMRWRHGLIREAVAAIVPLGERRALSLRAAEQLLSSGTAEGAAAAAAGLAAAGAHQRAAEIWLRLARRALAEGGLHSAQELIRRASGHGRPTAVAIAGVELATLSGRVEEALALGLDALDAARLEEHAELCLLVARAAITAGRWARADALVVRAGRPDQARSLILLADSAHGAGRVDEADRLAAAAVRSARTDSADALCEALCVRGRIHRLSDVGESRACFREAAQIASEHGFASWRVEALLGLGTLELLEDESSPTLIEARDAAVEIGLLGQAGRAEILLADHAFVRHGPRALTAPAAVLAETGAVLHLEAFGFISQVLLATRDALTGDTQAMAEGLRRFADLSSLPPDAQSHAYAIRAMAALLARDLPEAQRLLDAASRPLLDHASTAPLFHFGLWAVVSALTSGPDERARAALRRRPGVLRRANRGALCYADAVVAGRTGDADTAVAAYAAGDDLLGPVEWWRRFLRLFTLEAAITDGWGTPVPVLRGDLTVFEQAGEAPLARICRDLLRRAGAPTRRGRGDSTVPPELRALGITSREVDVLRLVAGGLGNAAISERLFLSPRTVETHVASLLTKSGAANRQQLRDLFGALTP